MEPEAYTTDSSDAAAAPAARVPASARSGTRLEGTWATSPDGTAKGEGGIGQK
jgi:hypothetical protein